MEYLVTMTSHVPEGTSPAEVDDVRAREAANSRRLADQGHLLRLWSPPLQHGEWRTLGLFAAPDATRLEELLAAMPLRVWRSDEATPLTPDPNDPGPASTGAPEPTSEFLVTFAPAAPDGAPPRVPEEAAAAQEIRTRELAAQGHLARLWQTPGEGHAIGLWRARDSAQLRDILESLPLAAWLSTRTTPLSEHPSDPGLRKS